MSSYNRFCPFALVTCPTLIDVLLTCLRLSLWDVPQVFEHLHILALPVPSCAGEMSLLYGRQADMVGPSFAHSTAYAFWCCFCVRWASYADTGLQLCG